MTKSNLGRKGFTWLTRQHLLLRGAKAGTWRQQLKQRPQRNYSLTCCLWLTKFAFFYHLRGGGTTHSSLDPQTPISNQRHETKPCPTHMLIRQPDECHLSVGAFFSRYEKLTTEARTGGMFYWVFSWVCGCLIFNLLIHFSLNIHSWIPLSFHKHRNKEQLYSRSVFLQSEHPALNLAIGTFGW